LIQLAVHIPEGRKGAFEIKHVTTDQVVGKHEPYDTYTILYKDGVEIMQDTTHEYLEHQALWDNAIGDVLIGGLGLGFVNKFLIANPKVSSITIVEKYQEVIDLVWDHCPKDETITLVHADITTWNPTQTYDIGWFDTWLVPDGDHSTYNQVLYERYKDICTWIGFW